MTSNAISKSAAGSPGSSRVRKKPSRKWFMLALLLPAAIVAGLFATREYNRYRFHLEKQTRFMMDTYVTVYAVGPRSKTLAPVNDALDRMQAVDAKFDSLNPDSPVYQFNRGNVPITDREILEVVSLALQIAKDTGGAFDITVAPLIELWGFYGDAPALPAPTAIERCLDQVGYTNLVLTGAGLEKKRADVQIDLGAIAKGYAVSQAAQELKQQGVTSALIDAGGDIYAIGQKAGNLWKVGIRKPRGDDILGYLEIADLAVMGSGDYERFFMSGGERYHHIFDPRTGYPAKGLSGTTVVHPDPTVADAWNTAIFVLGPEKGLDLVERIPGLETVMVTTSGEIIYSSGLDHALKAIE